MPIQRNQTFGIVFQAGTSGKQEKQIILDRKYAKATGWLALPNSLGGAAFVRVGLRDEQKVLADNTNIKFLDADPACPKRDRWTPLEVPADGTNLYITFDIPAPLTAAMSVDVVFNLTGE